MNAVVEVATATVATEVKTVTVIATVTVESPKVALPQKVATSALRVISIAGTSISAVAPDTNIILGGLAEAA